VCGVGIDQNAIHIEDDAKGSGWVHWLLIGCGVRDCLEMLWCDRRRGWFHGAS
jgi:hypothetical protein